MNEVIDRPVVVEEARAVLFFVVLKFQVELRNFELSKTSRKKKVSLHPSLVDFVFWRT